MSKINYLFTRIKRMSFGNMIDQAKLIHRKTSKPTFFILVDMVWCGFRYMAGYMDYVVFEFYNLNAKQRKTHVTRGKNNEFVKLLNDKNYWDIFNDKIEFNKRFAKYIKRGWLDLRNSSLEDFSSFVKKYPVIIVKPIDGKCGKGIEKITVDGETDVKKLYSSLLENGQVLAEEFIRQHKDLMKLFPNSLNTLRLVTINYKGKVSLVFAGIRMGMGNSVVDNLNSGGLAAVIDKETGIISTPGADKIGETFEKHPDTGTEIIGFEIPKFAEAVATVKEAATVVPQIGYAAWDIAVSDDDVQLIEGNQYPGHDIYQMPCHITDGYGILPVLNKAIGKE